MHERASRHRLAVTLLCAALVLAWSGTVWGAAIPFVSQLSFDVTIDAVDSGDGNPYYHYKYTASIPDTGSTEDCYGWYLMGADFIEPSTITQTDAGGYEWYSGEIVQPGDGPSNQTSSGLANFNDGPVVWWTQKSVADGTHTGTIGTFEFDSVKGPMTREWLAHSDGNFAVTGTTIGPSPGLSPILLLLGQGVPILGWIGYKRRRHA